MAKEKTFSIGERDAWVTATAAGRVLGLSAAAVTRYARLGRLPFASDVSKRIRLYSCQDIDRFRKTLAKARRAKARGK